MLVYGWEFFIFNPLEKDVEQTTQNKYISMYNKAYNTFINQICIPNPDDLIDHECDFTYYINFNGENDIINLDENYNYNFLRSVFLDKKFKTIRHEANIYYKKYNIDVLQFYIEYKGLFIILKKSKP